jgi:hypothetical protein
MIQRRLGTISTFPIWLNWISNTRARTNPAVTAIRLAVGSAPNPIDRICDIMSSIVAAEGRRTVVNVDCKSSTTSLE